jgi:cathepsin L
LRELHNYPFEKFVSDFKLGYKVGTPEFQERKEIFTKELLRIVAHNAHSDANNSRSSWKENVNHMTALTSSEKKALYGRNKAVAQNEKPVHQKEYPKNHKTYPVSSLPKEVDWRQEGVASAVKDQGHCGSCWAFASTAVIESHAAIASGLLFDLSPQQIAACAPNPDHCGGTGNCNGATSEIAFDYVAGSSGMVESFQYPYSEYFGTESACSMPPDSAVPKVHIDGYIQLAANNYEELMNAVAREGPIAVSVDASTWHSYDSGIFDGCDQAQPDINHAVVLMGYGTDNGKDYWLIRNSWSASFGEAGYIRIARESNEEQKCGTDVTPQDGVACEGDTAPQTVCGTCGVLFDSAYPTGVTAA